MTTRKRNRGISVPKEDEILLTEQEVWDIVNFARGLSVNSYGSGVLTPDLVNARMKEISLNPLAATEETLNRALQNPRDSEIAFLGFSENFEIQSQPYKRLMAYIANMLSWDITYDCVNAEFGDYGSKQYKKDLRILETFLDKFDFKKEFGTVVRELLRNEAYFCLTRFDGDKIILQELPSSPQYTKITGRWDYGLLYSLNMYWFLLPGVDLNLYPSFFKQKYNELWGNKPILRDYNPALMPEMRGDSSWVYWQDIPTTLGWAFKMSPEIATRLPYFTGLFLDLLLQPLMRNLQRNINMSEASKIIMGQVPLLKESKAQVKDMIAINPELLGKFLALVKSAIGESIKIASAPLEDTKAISFDGDNELYSKYLSTALASSGINSNLIFSGNIKPNAIETQLSLNVDEQIGYMMYPQFENFLEYHVNRFTSKFKFKFHFEGTHFFTNRQERFDKVMTLADKGIVLPQKIAAAMGMKPSDFQRQLDMARASGFVDNLTPIISSFQMGANLQGGRPKKNVSDLGESGEQTRSDGENLDKGGKV